MNYIDDIAKAIWEQLSPEDRGDTINWPLYRNYALLVLTTGTKTNLEHVHDAWSAWCAEVRPNHPSLIPFPLLSEEIQVKDEPYNWAILEVASWIEEDLKSRYESSMESE